ncbi:MAG: RNA 2',3'-cyclic phosphodiesterase [DPANN group archaeon]|nr:RNA 2',3'-cyclic phosphodiesterase [DPANN group archaeon]
MRLFIALDLHSINTYLDTLRASIGQEAVTLTKDAHLTLQFLGDVTPPVVDQIETALADVPFSTFSITLAGTGFFPDEERPRVVWLGVEHNDVLIKLQKDISVAMRSLGFEQDRRFHPHITLARIRVLGNRDAFLEKVNGLRAEKVRVPVETFALFESTLTPSGPKHDVIGIFPSSRKAN